MQADTPTRYPVRLGTSHGGVWTYFLESDNYVYQQNQFGRVIGWLCSFEVWERTMHKCLDKPQPA